MNSLLLLFYGLAVAACAIDFVPVPEPNPNGFESQPSIPISTRITNGNIAERNQFKYQVGLLLHAEIGNFWCGGTLISNRWIVTAAHCTDGMKSVHVYLGAWDRNNPKEDGQQIIFSGKRYIVVHEKWNSTTVSNDIALIKLPAPIKFNKFIQPAKLPKFSHANKYDKYVGRFAVTSGWGKTEEKVQPSTLRYIEKKIIKYINCKRYYFGNIKDDTQICIDVSRKQSTCGGDSGGPLVIQEDGEPVVIGATSFGFFLGCESGWPGVFTRITGFMDWIHEKTGIPKRF